MEKIWILMFGILMTLPTAKAELKDGKLTPCPDKPNCVCSMIEKSDDHYIASIDSYDLILDKIRTFIADHEKWSIVTDDPNYIHAIEKSSLFGFIDDVEFLVVDGKLHFRSASRTGYSDLGVNRKRIDKIKKYLK